MAALPYMQLYVADYLADTAHLTAAEHGAYLLLIFNYWQRSQPLNNTNERLANVARMSNKEWLDAKPILSEFFTINGDEWVHHRIEEDLAAVHIKSTKASNAGKASAKGRLNKRSANVQRTLNQAEAEAEADKELKALVNDDAVSVTVPVLTASADCPHEAIVALYHETLPELARIAVWDERRRTYLRSRWRESQERQSLDWWKRLFGYVGKSDFLMGRVEINGRKPFQANLEWILRPANFVKIIEGNYES